MHFIDETPNTASGTKVWVLNFMVGITMLVVGFFGTRLINQVDDIDKSLQTTREVQAAQTEIIKGLQRDLDNKGQDIEKLKNDVDRLKEINAELKAKLKVSSTLDTSKVADGGLFLFLSTLRYPHIASLSMAFLFQACGDLQLRALSLNYPVSLFPII
ncbi:hypothetical protein [Escherichia coli]|uniref:hypothetical protein n=1 Tax=Escherichia coli TaxID=562 RepID=UPI0020C982A6|nr:hypothetical protein [Escherichia coli]EIH4402091.1 hypothetical protein [Escherichia coli]UTP17217.1 hypothetical protein NML24_17090 [Escherichia coli]